MKQTRHYTGIRVLQAALASGLVLLICCLLVSFRTTRRLAGDLWDQLGISREQGTSQIRESFLAGYLHYYGAKNIRSIAAENRVAVARDLLAYTRQYLSSDVFRRAYEQQRLASKPSEPVLKNRSAEDIRKEEIEKTEKSIRETEESMKKMTPDMVKVMKSVVETFQNNLKEYRDPNSRLIAAMYQGEQNSNEYARKSYQESLKKWEQDYPADYRDLVRQRLKQFLDLAATVDFNAELKDVGTKKKFVNPQYEARPYAWKQVFRAGRDVTEATREFAQQWLAELK
ncbi:MAG TPA: hypothetical protein VG870_05145 [Chitinophagaceae bacterium]|nr:hypothetical protein [Chitinophagaceae bacterium]